MRNQAKGASGVARAAASSMADRILSWTSGSFEFEDGVVPKGAVDLKLSTSKLLLAAVQKAYGLENRPTPREFLAMGEPWRPWRTVACLYLWRSLR